MFRYMVLGLLRHSGALHGYALMKAYRERSGLQMSGGNFYRELQRLAGEGLVRMVVNPDGADPRRAPYEITEAGAAAFDAWLSRPNGTPLGQYDDELSTRVMFVAQAEPSLTRRSLERWQEELWMRSKMLERAREQTLLRPSGAGTQRFAALSLLQTRRLKHLAADLEFLEEFRVAYEQSVAPPKPEVTLREHTATPVRAAKRRPQNHRGKR